MDENSKEYWKKKYEDVNDQFDEFQKSSREFEAELELELKQREDESKELKSRIHRLNIDNDTLKTKLNEINVNTHKQITTLQEEVAKLKAVKDEMQRYIRELEQKNDDLERNYRCAVFSLGEFETKLNEALERNAILESELDEKDELAETVQRLRDEARDLKQELAVRQHRTNSIHNGSLLLTPKESNRRSSLMMTSMSSQDTMTTAILDSLTTESTATASNSMETESTTLNSANTHPSEQIQSEKNPTMLNTILNELNLKQQQQQQKLINGDHASSSGNNKLNGFYHSSPATISPLTRISALNYIGDALRKVTSIESRFINSRNLMKESNRDRRSATISAMDSRGDNQDGGVLGYSMEEDDDDDDHDHYGQNGTSKQLKRNDDDVHHNHSGV